MFQNYDHLGFITPYYAFPPSADGTGQNAFVTSRDLSDILSQTTTAKKVDVVALIEIISRFHCFADRTLVQGVYRTPWMARPNQEQNGWDYADIPQHGDFIMPEEEIARELFDRLQKEILEQCSGRSTIGVLLSGGMDSRMVAGVLEHLTVSRQIESDIVAITWGMEESRDAIYARRIAERLGWSWAHYELTAEDLYNNISEVAIRGAEFSPVHLHAMAKVRDIKGVDCILAASYGDSVGRAEYSGLHVSSLRPFEQYTLNWFKLLQTGAYKQASESIASDVARYREQFPRRVAYQRNEIDQQAHYMRRKLNHCFAVINERIEVYQAFSSPDVFGFMWSLSPQVRNNRIYLHMLDLFPTNTSDIPWARTGTPYLMNGEPLDDYPSLNHQYGTWIRGELYESIRSKALSDELLQLNIFNEKAIKSALATNRKISRQARATKLDEISIWLASLSEFVTKYDIRGISNEMGVTDNINGAFISPLQVLGLSVTKGILSRK